jgi:hypothetical protein
MVAFRRGTELAIQRVEPALPELPDAAEPLLELAESGRIELVNSVLRIHPRAHQMRALEHLQVLGHGRRAHIEPPRNVSGTHFTLRQHLDNAAAGWVGKGREAEHASIDEGVS